MANRYEQFKGWAVLLIFFSMLGMGAPANAQSSLKGTPYSNPMIWGDFPDLSVVRHGKDYYLISTTMHMMPGAPVMKSRDLVHWELVSYVFDSLSDNSKYDLIGGTVYGRGQWASSIRYHNGKYYVLFSPNDQPFRSYLYQTKDPTKKWKLVTRMQHFHDNSLFFDDDGKVYVFYGTGQLRELNPDLSGVKEGGIDMKIFDRDSSETGLLEGSQAIKYKGKYYLLMLSWPRGGKRRQVCYRADKITGPYEKKVILETTFAGFPYVGQGSIIDDVNGNWYGLIFQDRGAVGRVPMLMPVHWTDGWPMLGTASGHVPAKGIIPLPPSIPKHKIFVSDDFSGKKLKLNWQWNHNPINSAWSLKERPGFLRLKTARIVKNLYLAPNTISQRMFGPQSTATIKIDISHMKEGDVSGFAAFNGNSGVMSVKMMNGQRWLTMSDQVVDLSNDTKAVLKVDEIERGRVKLNNDIVYLRISGDFGVGKDTANFYYSLDNLNWKKLGTPFKMQFDYRRLFMGTRFAIFNYSTISTGGYVDIDYFRLGE
ncbi:glycoside hydrolase family 43 protein [Arachidicoccus terrestris]|uniref:glycoside hydrolase family 43 protein n=1 Tax=Arachidicoccus terrestris TaxID=2875539 RepID=UPI001CC672DF|nr:glycoside hydrolase 43 family protein [Arachidicoccus terrestris]UAY57032.1 glycoside hydrolase 43 family protein [Arachidicoccus terrestris]